MNCPECGEPLPDKAFICPHCGTPLLDRIICSDDMDEDSEASAPDVDDADVDVDELDDILSAFILWWHASLSFPQKPRHLQAPRSGAHGSWWPMQTHIYLSWNCLG